MRIFILTCIIFCASASSFSQGYTIKKFNWKDAGFKGTKPVYNQTVNIMSYGGNNNGSAANNTALNAAIAGLNGKGGVVYFPAGVYTFTNNVSLNRDSITFVGAGADNTQLRFNMSGTLNNCFNIWGSQVNTDTTSFSSPGVRDSNFVNVLNPSAFTPGQWIYLQVNDSSYMISNWAYGSLGQVMQIKSVAGNKITFESPFRFYYKLSLHPKIKKLNPRKAIGFECLKIQRMDATSGQTSLISYDKAVQCWIHGIEGDSTNFAHVELNRCSNVEITNSWFHHAFAYGGSGQGYGIAFQYSANECKAENNVFQHLRHSMLFQSGANGNVCGYNYSFDPYWSQFPFPANSSGDIVFHGNYPFANLCEGNINQNTVIDNSHDRNGPYNTLFRNRSELYGVVMNNNPASDTVQFLGLEITNTTSPYGQYLLYGNGHLQYGNIVQSSLTPPGTNNLIENSLYYSGTQRPPCFVPGVHHWPVIGIPNNYNTGSNAAKDRTMQGLMTACSCSTLTTGATATSPEPETLIYPNPASEIIYLENMLATEVIVYDVAGSVVLNKVGKNIHFIDITSLSKGIYFLYLKSKNSLKTYKFIKD
jgi:hypothetical protein